MGRVPAPQGRNHHHRPVISFKEQPAEFITASDFQLGYRYFVVFGVGIGRNRCWNFSNSQTSRYEQISQYDYVSDDLRTPP